MDAKAVPTRFVIETSQLITLAVCCSYVSNLIGRRTINIPEIILGVNGFHCKFPVSLLLSNCTFYTQTKKTVNTENISGMFIVF